VHGAPTVIDYNLALNQFFRQIKIQVGISGHARIFQPPVHIWQFKPCTRSFTTRIYISPVGCYCSV